MLATGTVQYKAQKDHHQQSRQRTSRRSGQKVVSSRTDGNDNEDNLDLLNHGDLEGRCQEPRHLGSATRRALPQRLFLPGISSLLIAERNERGALAGSGPSARLPL
jgi:hypothetical protein